MKPYPKRMVYLGVAVLVLGATAAAGFAVVPRLLKHGHGPGGASPTAVPMSVKTIRPKLDPTFVVRVTQPAYVEPYFLAPLESRISGTVKYVFKARGDHVRQDELLAQIDAPDLTEAVAMKEAVVAQRRSELRLSEAKVPVAVAQVDVTRWSIDVRQAEVDKATADVELKQLTLGRYQTLASRTATTGDMAQEAAKDLGVARGAFKAAAAGVKKAEADLREAQGNLQAAQEDVAYRRSLIEVARRDVDQARAMLELANIRAPFDGEIVDRRIDKGSYVQAASVRSGGAAPLTIARIDTVTVGMKLPDDFADLIGDDTEATLRIFKRPGLVVRGRVSRFPRLIEGDDRTVRVEVDLYNSDRASYDRLIRDTVAEGLAVLGAGQELTAAGLLAHDQSRWQQRGKGGAEPFPRFPDVSGSDPDAGPTRLMAGMYGTMSLALSSPRKAFLLPSKAVINQAGNRFIMVVEGGKARLTPVRVEWDDGNRVKLSIVRPASVTPLGNSPKTVRDPDAKELQDLHGDEEVILTGQGDISDGQPVQTVPTAW
jgi:multidrug efflux pump subunit AcrA (membrane-fusion protein)